VPTQSGFTHLSLFTGIGGLDLAAEWAGFTTVGQCEWADYPTKILEKHWPEAPRWRDIRTLTGESFYERTGLRTVDVISGGFPCQPFSIAGRKKGDQDNRFLWPEMRRVIAEIRSRWIVGENVANFANMALDGALFDLEAIGYEAWTIVFPACAVDAPHERMRTAVIAYADSERREGREQPDAYPTEPRRWQERPFRATTELCTLDNTMSGGCGGDNRRRQSPLVEDRRRWSTEPDVGRVAHGVPARVDRLKALGNAAVPQQFYPIFRAIMEEISRKK
jgi:DNA (cytosine-5)-methyltransferase 1